jgi:hypothetical protein
MTTHKDQMSSTARDYWEEPEELEFARALVGKKHQDDPAHRWYRLPSHESFAAGCSCGWVSPERKTFDEMTHDVVRHLDAVRPEVTAPT